MKARIIYLPENLASTAQKEKALISLKQYSWEIEEIAGHDKNTNTDSMQIIPGSRLETFPRDRLLSKKACIQNHIDFFEAVVAADEPMAFFEHDVIAIAPMPSVEFEDYLILNFEEAITKHSCPEWRDYSQISSLGTGVQDLPENYKVIYYKDTVYKDSSMVPGTAAYAITPSGANKMLEAISKYGADQSDFQLNSFNLRIQVLNPSIIRMQPNLRTSGGFK